jgi:uncharacterized oligopeptide transporter (OPT) family protein
MTEDPEAKWLREVYQPSATNLTARAVIVGMLIGGLMCISNLYVFFKTGWSMGVTLTACIIAFALFRLLRPLGVAPLTVLENNALTTVASGAGFMTGGGNMAAYGALLMILVAQPGVMAEPSRESLIYWFASIAALGVFVAIPIKRQLINKEALAFPTGTATAVTLRSLHGVAAPIVPHACHVLWNHLGNTGALIDAQWPAFDASALVQSKVNIAAQVNGKLRAVLELPADVSKEQIEKAAFADETVQKFTAGLSVKKVIGVPGKLINIVVAPAQ